MSGVLQGCPLSGTLFAIALGPFLDKLDRILGRGAHEIVRACADDIGAVVNFSRSLVQTAPVFDSARAAAGLATKPCKCVILPVYTSCSISTVTVCRDWLTRQIPAWSGFLIQPAARYLGVHVEPAAGEKQ